MQFLNILSMLSDVRVLRILFLGFSSGLPILLIFSTLSLWLNAAGIDRSTITIFSLAGLAYSFKFLWAPIMDRISIPYLTNFVGHRKSWLMLSQLFLISFILIVSFIDPNKNLFFMGLIIFCVGLASASQDALVDTYRIESAPISLQSIMSGVYVIGYRIGMITSGAGSLYIASYLGAENNGYDLLAWQNTYLIMALIQFIGFITCLLSPEPSGKNNLIKGVKDKIRLILIFVLSVFVFIAVNLIFPEIKFENNFISFFFSSLKFVIAINCSAFTMYFFIKINFIKKTIIKKTFYDPILDFIFKNGKLAITLLLIVGLYRISDIVMGVIANLFYADLGFSLQEIATYSKFYGLGATLIGGLLGGYIAIKLNVITALIIGGILSSASNLLFALLTIFEPNTNILLTVITIDNLSGGIATTVFVAFLSSLTNKNFTTTQFAILTSLMLIFPKLISGYSGLLVNFIGYTNFFIFTALIGVPVIVLMIYYKNIMLRDGI